MSTPKDLLLAKKIIYDAFGFNYARLFIEKEGVDYEACTFELNDKPVKFRTAKITPTKTGQFVTLWKRNANGIIEPFCDTDAIDLFVASVRKQDHFGQFVFPKTSLCEHGIITTGNKEGKRAMRVYPPWDKTENRQAQRSQAWQLKFFLEIGNGRSMDAERVKLLYGLKKQTPHHF
jgi:hypothetical protein